MANYSNETPLSKAALVAGLGLLISALAAPYAELYVIPKMIIPFKAAETAKNIMGDEALFVSALFAYLVTFVCDILVAWALYVLLKPVSKNQSLLVAWFRLVYTIIAFVALNNLVTAFRLLTTPEYLTLFEADHLYAHAMVYLRAFRNHWYFGLILFGIHLMLLGYLVYKSKFIPRIMGALLILAGLGYFLTSIRPFLFPDINIDFARYTFFGELVFMLWLLIKGSRIKEIKPDLIQ